MNKSLEHLAIVAILCICTSPNAFADDEARAGGWNHSLIADITTTQTSYSDSWVGGEAGSVNWVSNINALAEKQLKHWLAMKSTLKLSFGQTLTQDAESKRWSKPKKSTDLIDFENVGRITLGGPVDPYAAVRIESQFFDGQNDNKKLFFSPVKLTESAGLSRELYREKDDFLLSRLGVGIRQVIKTVIVDSSAIGGLPGAFDYLTSDSTLTDGGLESVSDATLSLHKNIRYTGKLTLYKALFFSGEDALRGTSSEDNWQAVDINWENIFSATVTRLITVNLYAQLLYDKEISAKGRFKQTLALGVVYKML